MRYTVLTPGKKLLSIRKKIGATQKDIACDSITREMVSLIENNKSKLLDETALKLINNINKIIEDKELNINHITLDELMEDTDKKIDKILELCKYDLEQIAICDDHERDLQKKIEEIEEFFSEYFISPKQKCKIYEIIASIFFKDAEWEESKIYYLICRDISLINEQDENVLKYLAALTRVYYRLNNPKEIISIGKFGIQIINKYKIKDSEDVHAIYCNSALAYCKLKKINEAIEILKKILLMPNIEKDKMLEIFIQIGSCYLYKKEYKVAEKYFTDVVDKAIHDTNVNAAALAYLNLATVKYETGDYYFAEIFTDKASKIKATDIFKITTNLYNMVLLYIKIDKIGKVDNYYIQAIEYSIMTQNEGIQKDLLYKLSDYFISNRYYKSLEELLTVIKNKIYKKELKIKEVIEIYMLAAESIRKTDKNKFMEIYLEGINIINFLEKHV